MVTRIALLLGLVAMTSSVAFADYGRSAQGRMVRDFDGAATLTAPSVGPLLPPRAFDSIASAPQPLRLQSLSTFDLVHAHFAAPRTQSYFLSLDNLSAPRTATAPTGPLLSIAAFDSLSR